MDFVKDSHVVDGNTGLGLGHSGLIAVFAECSHVIEHLSRSCSCYARVVVWIRRRDVDKLGVDWFRALPAPWLILLD